MYLSKIILENQGPIKNFELDLNNSTQPIILVGENGTGKTVLLSYIADALYEFGKQSYKDLLGDNISTDNYFRILGAINRNINEKNSLAYLKFKDINEYEYIEKTGEYKLENIKKKYNLNTKLTNIDEKNNIKKVTNNKDEFKKIFSENVIGYFMPDRFEKPHWINSDLKVNKSIFDLDLGYSDTLEKPIMIEESLELNKQWILGVYLDSLVDIDVNSKGYYVSENQNLGNKRVYKITR